MSENGGTARRLLPRGVRWSLGTLYIFFAVIVLGGAAFIAIESHPSVVADLGKNTALLVTLGKACGLLAGALILIQFVLAAHLKTLDNIFSLHRLLFAHRSVGIATVILATLHPILMFGPATVDLPEFKLNNWPTYLGILFLIVLWTGGLAGIWRRRMSIPYHRWFFMHRIGMFCAVLILALHVLNVARDFLWGRPRSVLIISLAVYALLFILLVIVKPLILRRNKYSINKVEHVGRRTYALDLEPLKGTTFSYAPGQFAFVTFYSHKLPAERHPWTISSSPEGKKVLQFTIKQSGDFTENISNLKVGDTAVVDGPYGLFSYTAFRQERKKDVIMIAGGVGVTPMLSMIRHIVETGDKRKVLLIWSNKTEADILFHDELAFIVTANSNISIQHVLTGQKDFKGLAGRLDAGKLKKLTAGYGQDAEVFVCGPPQMMAAVCGALGKIGFSSHQIHTETFSY